MRWASITSLIATVLLAPTALAAWGMPKPITDRLKTIESIYTQLLVVGAIVFLFVFGWLVLNLVKFRPGGEGEPTFEDHRGDIRAEILWTVVPILIVAWVGFISYDGLQSIQAEPQEEIGAEIKMKGYQWFWQAQYTENVKMSQQPGSDGNLSGAEPFLIPANKPVKFNVTSGDVIHGFWIPELGVKVDAIPGRNNVVTVTAPPGEYLIQCSEFCGQQHAYMRAKVKAVPQDTYQQWLSEKKRQAATGGLQKSLNVNLTSDGIQASSDSTVAGIETSFKVTNQADQARSFSVEGTNASTGEIGPGESATVNVTLEAGDYTMTSGDATASLTAQEAESVTVSLTEWAVNSQTTQFEAGTPYLITVENQGESIHNLYLGDPEEKAGSDTIYASTENLNPGDTTTLLFEPSSDQTGTHTWWCDIGGHYAQGMHSEFEITGG